MDPKRPKDLSSHLVDLDWERCGCESKPLFFFKPAIPIGGVPPSLGAPACVCAKHCPFLAGDWEEPCGSSPLRPPQLGNGEVGGLKCYTTWWELWFSFVSECRGRGPSVPCTNSRRLFSYHRRLGKGHVSPVMVAGVGQS